MEAILFLLGFTAVTTVYEVSKSSKSSKSDKFWKAVNNGSKKIIKK